MELKGANDMSIRDQAKRLGHEIIGNLERHPEFERGRHERCYMDEAQNEYILVRGILTIITADGGVI